MTADCEEPEKNNDTPLVVIRCITYNHEPYIRDALEGFVMQQTNFPFVAVVHDDASTDGTAAIIREYAERYPAIIKPVFETENQYSKHDGSLTRIMDDACRAIAGAKYYALCEGDDYWTDPFKLQTQVDFLESHPDYGMCYTKTVFYNQSSKRFHRKPFGGPWESFDDLVTHNFVIPTATVLGRQELFKRFSAEIKQYWAMGDSPLAFFFAIYSKIKFLPIVTSVYRILEKSACHFTNMEDALRFYHSGIDAIKFFVKLSGKEELLTNIIARQYNGELSIAYKFQNYTHAHKYSNISRNDSLKIFLMKLFAKSRLSFFFASKSFPLLRKIIVRYFR